MVIVDDEIISGFIGEVVSRCLDFSWTKIKESVKNRKNKHQNIESQIYNVVVNVLNQITYNKFEDDQDKIYQAAEKLLFGYKDSRCESIEVVKSGLQILGENVNSDKYIEFKNLLYQEFGKDDYEELYRQISLLQQDEESSKATRIEKKIDKVQQSVDEAKRKLDAFQEDNNRGVDNFQNKEPVKSRTQEYADKWNQNMFLNDFDKRDENAGVNIKLKEVYLENHLPHYIWGSNKTQRFDLRDLLSEYIYGNSNRMLLILGQPGIGKSTLATWIIVNFIDRINDILVYRFASDLKSVDWQKSNVAGTILETLGLSFDNLNGKTLILDGFDEINVGDNGKEILDKIYGDFIYRKDIKNLSLVITCRENYISEFERINSRYITLQAWDEMQIRSFCTIFQDKSHIYVSEYTMENILKNKEVLGIPLILYMVLALNISIEKEGSIVDVYDRIFSIEGGIYDRCIGNKSFADRHRISEVKKQVHQISRKIAVWIFENNSAEAYIPKEEYEKICNSIIQAGTSQNKNIQQDFLIGNYFKLVKHCDGIETEKLYFVHRSIYEYFVAETIYNSIENAMIKLTDESQEELAGSIVIYLKRGRITNTIGDYLQFKILKLYNSLNDKKKENFYQWWEKAVTKMLGKGMFYYAGEGMQNYKYVIDEEIQCFYNLVKVLKSLLGTGKRKYIMEDSDKKCLEKYIRLRLAMCKMEETCGVEIFDLSKISLVGINLSGVDFTLTNLNGADLRGANLCGANFKGMNLGKTDLREVDLSNANLIGTNLIGTNLCDTDLEGADLREATLAESQIKYLEYHYDLEGTYVYIKAERKIITYKKYCELRQ